MSIASIVHPWCHKVLPLTYDESLSYYEVLCKLRYKINEVIDVFNSYEEIIQQLQGEIDDINALKKAVNELQERADTIDNMLNNFDAEDKHLQKQIDELTTLVNNVVNGYDNIKSYVDNKYNELQQKIDNQSYIIYSEMYTLIGELQREIEALNKALKEIDTQIYNPWARVLQKESIQKNIDYAYADLSDLVPLASEYSELGLTANEYSEKNITAYEYSARGRKHLRLDFVFSPVYGFKQEINNVLTSIINFLCNTLNATEYASLDLTADDYATLNLTADDYYRYNPSLTRGFVQVSDLGGGLTRAEYEKLEVVES